MRATGETRGLPPWERRRPRRLTLLPHQQAQCSQALCPNPPTTDLVLAARRCVPRRVGPRPDPTANLLNHIATRPLAHPTPLPPFAPKHRAYPLPEVVRKGTLLQTSLPANGCRSVRSSSESNSKSGSGSRKSTKSIESIESRGFLFTYHPPSPFLSSPCGPGDLSLSANRVFGRSLAPQSPPCLLCPQCPPPHISRLNVLNHTTKPHSQQTSDPA